MKILQIHLSSILAILLCSGLPAQVQADASSARLAMEDAGNPLVLVGTSRGDIYLEMLRQEAPVNVQRFMDLATGAIEIFDTATNTGFRPRYYDGMRFHRVLPGFIIQAGSPAYHALGAPGATLNDEINADALGLNLVKAMAPNGEFNDLLGISDKSRFDTEILQPLYRNMGIDTLTELITRQDEVLQRLQNMSVKDVYVNQGYRYSGNALTRPVIRGVVALANQGPNTNGPEFFISLSDAPWLNGKHTVIARVVEGMDVVDAIGELAIDPLRFVRESTVIYSVTIIE